MITGLGRDPWVRVEGLCSYSLHSYGVFSYGVFSYGLYGYGLSKLLDCYDPVSIAFVAIVKY